jgi:hypothetical protein
MHESVEIFLERRYIELLELFVIIKVWAKWVGLCIVLMQDVEVEGIWPPMGI